MIWKHSLLVKNEIIDKVELWGIILGFLKLVFKDIFRLNNGLQMLFV